jgi:hypothetical protein
MRGCECVCMCVCVSLYLYTFIDTCVYIRICVSCMDAYAAAYKCNVIYMYVCVFIVSIFRYVCVYICVCVCVEMSRGAKQKFVTLAA